MALCHWVRRGNRYVHGTRRRTWNAVLCRLESIDDRFGNSRSAANEPVVTPALFLVVQVNLVDLFFVDTRNADLVFVANFHFLATGLIGVLVNSVHIQLRLKQFKVQHHLRRKSEITKRCFQARCRN